MTSFDNLQRDLFEDAAFSPLPTINKPSPSKPDRRKLAKISEAARRAQRVNKKINSIGEGQGIKQRAIEDHLTILSNLGCQYLVYTDYGVTYEHGEDIKQLLEPQQPLKPAKSRTQRLPVGTFSTHYKPILDPLQVGDVGIVPFKNVMGVGLDPSRLNSAISAYGATHWGVGSCSTFVNRKAKCIEVLRKK